MSYYSSSWLCELFFVLRNSINIYLKSSKCMSKNWIKEDKSLKAKLPSIIMADNQISLISTITWQICLPKECILRQFPKMCTVMALFFVFPSLNCSHSKPCKLFFFLPPSHFPPHDPQPCPTEQSVNAVARHLAVCWCKATTWGQSLLHKTESNSVPLFWNLNSKMKMTIWMPVTPTWQLISRSKRSLKGRPLYFLFPFICRNIFGLEYLSVLLTTIAVTNSLQSELDSWSPGKCCFSSLNNRRWLSSTHSTFCKIFVPGSFWGLLI